MILEYIDTNPARWENDCFYGLNDCRVLIFCT